MPASHVIHKPLGGQFFTPMKLVLVVLIAVAAYFLAHRFLYGLGSVTNLNPGYPWGMWVVVDVVIGTAFGCGGFAMALLVYIFNRDHYHPLMRPALLGGLFGYTLAGAAVMIDLGRYWQAYNMFLPWYASADSVMLEVGLCVTAYIIVLWIEFSPAFMERFGWFKAKEKLTKWIWIPVALGIVLPVMHQSSLGSLLLVMGSQLHPLWYTSWLPLLFLISALTMGYAVVMFEATVVSKTFYRVSEQPLLSRLSITVAALVWAWIVFRLLQLAVEGHLPLAFEGTRMAALFWLEMFLYAVAGTVLTVPKGRASARSSFLAAALLLVVGSLYRLDAFLIAYQPTQNWSYFPSVPELMVTLGVIAFEIFAYLVFIKFLPVLHAPDPEHPGKGLL